MTRDGVTAMKHRTGSDRSSVGDDDLGSECEAYLSGDYLRWLLTAGLPVAGWAWLNRAAHGDLDDLRHHVAELGVPSQACCFPHAALLVEAMVVTTTAADDLHDLQLDLLIPLELEVMSQTVSPRALVERVSRTLY